jgi:hypothetical protein
MLAMEFQDTLPLLLASAVDSLNRLFRYQAQCVFAGAMKTARCLLGALQCCGLKRVSARVMRVIPERRCCGDIRRRWGRRI